MDFLIKLLVVAALALIIWFLVKVIRCVKCSTYSVSIYLSTSGVINVDNTIPLPGSANANAVIRQNGTPVPNAVFDSDPSWVINDPTIISFAQTGVQTGLVTALAAGQTTLDVDGQYLGNSVHGTALVTVTATAAGFDVDIQWTNNPSVAAPRK